MLHGSHAVAMIARLPRLAAGRSRSCYMVTPAPSPSPHLRQLLPVVQQVGHQQLHLAPHAAQPSLGGGEVKTAGHLKEKEERRREEELLNGGT